MTPGELRSAKARIRKQGPCLICGNVPYAAHRLIDAQMARVAAGESLEDVAADYDEDSATAMVGRWIALMHVLYDCTAKKKRNRRARGARKVPR